MRSLSVYCKANGRRTGNIGVNGHLKCFDTHYAFGTSQFILSSNLEPPFFCYENNARHKTVESIHLDRCAVAVDRPLQLERITNIACARRRWCRDVTVVDIVVLFHSERSRL